MKGYVIEVEKLRGEKLQLTKDNILIKDEIDMDNVEYWENRLEELDQPYVIAYRKRQGQILYTIFTRMRGKGSPFR